MPTEKRVKGVVIPRHDTMLNWSKALNFVPAKGELIVYDADSAETVANGYDASSVVIGTTAYELTPSDKPRFKFGNGVDNVNVLPFTAAQVDEYIAESQAGTSTTEWTYTVFSNNIFIGSVNTNYNATITAAEERVQAINAAFPVTFAYTPAVTITLSNTDGDEHWIESQTVTTTALQDVTFAMLAAESATISGTLNITVIGVVA